MYIGGTEEVALKLHCFLNMDYIYYYLSYCFTSV